MDPWEKFLAEVIMPWALKSSGKSQAVLRGIKELLLEFATEHDARYSERPFFEEGLDMGELFRDLNMAPPSGFDPASMPPMGWFSQTKLPVVELPYKNWKLIVLALPMLEIPGVVQANAISVMYTIKFVPREKFAMSISIEDHPLAIFGKAAETLSRLSPAMREAAKTRPTIDYGPKTLSGCFEIDQNFEVKTTHLQLAKKLCNDWRVRECLLEFKPPNFTMCGKMATDSSIFSSLSTDRVQLGNCLILKRMSQLSGPLELLKCTADTLHSLELISDEAAPPVVKRRFVFDF